MFSCSNSSNFTSPISFRVLVVDDDSTHLSTVVQILLCFGYEVEKFHTPAAALLALQTNNYMYDIVVCGVSTSDLYGLRLVQFAGLELDIPVVLMNLDSSHEVAMRGILYGASKCLAKPIQPEALENIWQIVVSKRRDQFAFFPAQIHAPVSVNSAGPSSEIVGSPVAAIAAAAHGGGEPSCSNPKPNLKKRQDQATALKKPRLIWTDEYHKIFLDAIKNLEFGKIVPTKILEYMRNNGFPNISRENVASHLQKHRLYIKKLENNNEIYGSSKLSSQSCINETNGEKLISFPANRTLSIKNNTPSSCSTSNLPPPDESHFLDKNNWEIVVHDQEIMPNLDQNMNNNASKVSQQNNIIRTMEHPQPRQIVPLEQEKDVLSVDLCSADQLLLPPILSDDQIFNVDGNNIPIKSGSQDSKDEPFCFKVLEDYEAMYLNDCGDGFL